MRYVMALALVLGLGGGLGGGLSGGLGGPAAAQQGLTNALDRLESQRTIQQFQMKREIERQQQDLQRQQDQVRVQQLIDRQQLWRLPPVPCPSPGPPALC